MCVFYLGKDVISASSESDDGLCGPWIMESSEQMAYFFLTLHSIASLLKEMLSSLKNTKI